jgi:glutamate dehydrogenase
MEIFQLRELWDWIELLDYRVSTDVQLDMMLRLVRLVKRATRWMLRNRRHELAPTPLVAEFLPGLERLSADFPDNLRGRAEEQYQAIRERYLGQGVGEELARRVAATQLAYTALGIIQAAADSGSDLNDVANLYFSIGERLELDWFGSQILAAKVDSEWQALARDAYLEDLEWQQRTLAVGALQHLPEDRNMLTCLRRWEQQEEALLQRWRNMLAELHATATPDFAMFAVANRELLDLAQSSLRASWAAENSGQQA